MLAIEASMQPQRPELGSELGAVHSRVLNRPQRSQRRLLRLGHSPNPGGINALLRPVAPHRLQLLAALEIPHLNGIIIAATGQSPPIGPYAGPLDATLMPLPKSHALAVRHVPP